MRQVFTFILALSLTPMAWGHKLSSYEVVADDLAEQLVQQLSSKHVDDGFSQLGLTRWVMAETLELPNTQDALAGLSHQLSESLHTHLQQRNVRLVEYRAQDFVSLSEKGATALSRDVDALQQQPQLDWLLVGTMARKDDGVVVNLRVVNRQSQQVLAAANQFVPKHLYWQSYRTTEMVDGKLQRHR